MSLPVTVPFTFGNATTAQSLSSLDTNFTTITNSVNGLTNGASKINVASITATGIASNATYLRGDGAWASLNNSATVNLIDFMNARYGVGVWSYRSSVAVGTDAGPAINDALQYIRTNFGRGTLVIPPNGLFLVNTAIDSTLLAGNNIIGYGSQASGIVYNVNNSSAFLFTGANGYSGGGIQGLAIFIEAGIGTLFSSHSSFRGTGSISGTTLTITATAAGQIDVGDTIYGTGVTSGTTVTAFGSGSGGNGTYTVSASQTVASTQIGTITGKKYALTNAITLYGDSQYQADQMVFSDLYVTSIAAPGYDTSYWNYGLQIYGIRTSPQGVRVGQWSNIQLFNNYGAGIIMYNAVQHSFSNIGIYTGQNNGNNCYIQGGSTSSLYNTQLNFQNLTVSGELVILNTIRCTISGSCASFQAGSGCDYYDLFLNVSGAVNTTSIGANGLLVVNGAISGFPPTQVQSKAWVRWGSTGTIASSYNVSSVTKNATGNWTVYYLTNLVDANYVPIGMTAGGASYGNYGVYMQQTSAPTTTYCAVTTLSNSGVAVDCISNQLVVFGN
jgi:hypothetical protein